MNLKVLEASQATIQLSTDWRYTNKILFVVSVGFWGFGVLGFWGRLFIKKHHKTDKTTVFFGHFIEKVLLLYSLLLPLFPIFKSTVASQQKHFHRNCSKQDRNASLENNTTIANYVLKINHHLYFLSNGF